MTQGLSDSTLYVNNELIPYEPNSLKYEDGVPERKVNPQVVGGGATTNVTNDDFTTAMGKVTFDMKSTSINEILEGDWKANFENNVVRIVSTDGVSRVFQEAVVVNKVEVDLGADGVISIEFNSLPAAIA